MGMSLYRYYTNQLVFYRFIEGKNMPEREDFEDVIVQPFDGVIAQGDMKL